MAEARSAANPLLAERMEKALNDATEAHGRRTCEEIALILAALALSMHGPPEIAQSFIQTRLVEAHRCFFGTSNVSNVEQLLLERFTPFPC